MAEETKNTQTEQQPLAEEQSFFSLESIFRMLVLNWQWFVLSLIVALGIAFLYLRYTTPVYNTYAKILVKGSDSRGSGASQALSIGDIIQNYGLSNERQILKSSTTAAEVVRDLEALHLLYVAGTCTRPCDVQEPRVLGGYGRRTSGEAQHTRLSED